MSLSLRLKQDDYENKMSGTRKKIEDKEKLKCEVAIIINQLIEGMPDDVVCGWNENKTSLKDVLTRNLMPCRSGKFRKVCLQGRGKR